MSSIQNTSEPNSSRWFTVNIGSLGIVAAIALKVFAQNAASAYALGSISALLLAGSATGTAAMIAVPVALAACSACAAFIYASIYLPTSALGM